MAISLAVERANAIYIYDENNAQIAMMPIHAGQGNGLKGYTATRVSVQRDGMLYIYDERGAQVGLIPIT